MENQGLRRRRGPQPAAAESTTVEDAVDSDKVVGSDSEMPALDHGGENDIGDASGLANDDDLDIDDDIDATPADTQHAQDEVDDDAAGRGRGASQAADEDDDDESGPYGYGPSDGVVSSSEEDDDTDATNEDGSESGAQTPVVAAAGRRSRGALRKPADPFADITSVSRLPKLS